MIALDQLGIDDFGLFEDGAYLAGFVYRHLFILDLLPLKHERMANNDGRVVPLFNGVNDNFRELRAELGAAAHLSRPFR